MAFENIAAFFKRRFRSELGDSTMFISDRHFCDQLDQVHKLKQFFFKEKVRFSAEQIPTIDLGPLNNLHYHASGRPPTDEQWRLLDEKLTTLASYLDDNLRRKFRIRELGFFFGSMPLIFLSLTVGSTIFYSVYPRFLSRNTLAFDLAYIVSLVTWTIAQGGLGACAFLVTQVAIQDAPEATQKESPKESADITDINVLKGRIVLGCLFAALIGLPISYEALNKIWKSLFNEGYNVDASDFVLILVPFLLGFSANLVLLILRRCISSLQAFFGIQPTK